MEAGPGRTSSPASTSCKLPGATAPRRSPCVFDAAFLTTSTELVYPFLGDVDAPPSTYFRFRIDELPKSGLTLGAQKLRLHYDPWVSGRGWFNPGSAGEDQIRTAQEDWLHALVPVAGPGQSAAVANTNDVQLLLEMSPPPDPAKVRGATQFTALPHADYAVRKIDWNEPEGLRISLVADVKTYLHRLPRYATTPAKTTIGPCPPPASGYFR